jgi:hypothetical protein
MTWLERKKRLKEGKKGEVREGGGGRPTMQPPPLKVFNKVVDIVSTS